MIYLCKIPSILLAGLGGVPGARPLPRVQILSFRHTKFSKCNRLRSPRPPFEVHAPLREILDPPLNFSCFILSQTMTAPREMFKYDTGYYVYLPGLWMCGRQVPGAFATFNRTAVDAAVNVELRDTDVMVATYPKTGEYRVNKTERDPKNCANFDHHSGGFRISRRR